MITPAFSKKTQTENSVSKEFSCPSVSGETLLKEKPLTMAFSARVSGETLVKEKSLPMDFSARVSGETLD